MARKSSTFSLTGIIAKRRSYLAEARQELNMLQDRAAELRAAIHVVNMVADYANEREFTQWNNVSTWMLGNTPELVVGLEGTVGSLKHGVIVDIIERAMACGFEVDHSTDHVSDWATQRVFTFKQEIAGVRVELKVTANIAANSATCRKVQVGTELKEVAKYEIVCE